MLVISFADRFKLNRLGMQMTYMSKAILFLKHLMSFLLQIEL
jgi:hypothetical protein